MVWIFRRAKIQIRLQKALIPNVSEWTKQLMSTSPCSFCAFVETRTTVRAKGLFFVQLRTNCKGIILFVTYLIILFVTYIWYYYLFFDWWIYLFSLEIIFLKKSRNTLWNGTLDFKELWGKHFKYVKCIMVQCSTHEK